MSLNIWWDGEINATNPHYAKLSDNDKRFLCPPDLLSDMSVPTLLMLTHIGFVSEDSIPHILGRIDFANGQPIAEKLEDRSKKWGHESLEAHLRIYCGVTSNWPTLSKPAFVKLIGKFTVPDLSAPAIQRMITRENRRRMDRNKAAAA